jgi:uncharacterized membrane protein
MMMRERGALFTGVGVGAGLMYFLDPQQGRRRRARLTDQLAHSARVGADAMSATRRDTANRASGVAAALRSRVQRHAEPDDDTVVAQRVRAQLGRVVSHPAAIEVQVQDCRVTLRGPILQAEVKRLLSTVARVRGVRDVVNELHEHKQAGNVPALQGGGRLSSIGRQQRLWAPSTRFIVGAAGTALAGYGGTRRDTGGAVLALAGAGLLARAATNLDVRRLTGIGAGRRAVDVEKTITVAAPVEDVFAFWSAYENFPRFMSRVLEVRPSAREMQSHWTVVGPAGTPVSFDSELTAYVPNRILGWRTVPGSMVAHAGLVRFEPDGEWGTRIQVRLSYNPPGGWIGHKLASAFGADPKRSLDEDLARMKTLIETGRPARDAARPLPH